MAKAVVRRAPPRAKAPEKSYIVVHVITVSRHKSRDEASKALKGVKLKGNDISFVMEEGSK